MLLLHHTYGALNRELPGGIGEESESHNETAVREVFEETGLAVSAVGITGCYYMLENESLHFVFRCELLSPAASLVPDGDEVSECAYCPIDSVPRPISDWTVKHIRDAVTGRIIDVPSTVGPRIWLK